MNLDMDIGRSDKIGDDSGQVLLPQQQDDILPRDKRSEIA